MNHIGKPGVYGIEHHGLLKLKNVFWNLTPPNLIEHAIRNKEVQLSDGGAINALTEKHTGRSPKDRYIVDNIDVSEYMPIHWGDVNKPISEEIFDQIFDEFISKLRATDVYVQDLAIGAHPNYQMPIRIITGKAWHNLFANNLFIRPLYADRVDAVPEFTVIQSSKFHIGQIKKYGINSDTFIGINFKKKLVLVIGSGYAGEIKKAMFSVMNFLLPHKDVLPMHCSANIGEKGDTALFFGLSGTGKTTLSSAPNRRLIGDDEHGWCDTGVFNFEGGCYAKTINLEEELEPAIYHAVTRFGAITENVLLSHNRHKPDFSRSDYTENTRGAYPLDFIPGFVESGTGGHPNNIFFLTADAFGVMPPISRLSPEQAMYYFLSGYTAKLAGTERGLGKEPQATFSTCFGAPFMPLNPKVYAELLRKRINKHNANVWLVNTGWSGGPYGVGSRIKLKFTRAMINAAINGDLSDINYDIEPHFGLSVPTACPEVPSELLKPELTWENQEAYIEAAKNLNALFKENYKQFE